MVLLLNNRIDKLLMEINNYTRIYYQLLRISTVVV